MKVTRPHRSVVRVEAAREDYPDGFHILIRSDAHCDSPQNNWKQEKSHLDLALAKQAAIVDMGDMFDAMQGRGDPRSDPSDLLPELKELPYMDRLVEFARRRYIPYAKNWIVLQEGNHECVSMSHEVLTFDGWKYAEDVTRDDYVASLNPETHEFEYMQPHQVHKYRYTGDLLAVNGASLKMEVTPNHRVCYLDKRGELAYREAGQLEGMSIGVNVPVASKALHSEDYPLSDNEIRLTAWLMTDGSIKSKSLVLYQSKPEMVGRIRGLLDNLGVVYRETVRERDIKEICGKVLKNPCLPSHEFHIGEAASEKLIDVLSLKDRLNFPFWVRRLSQRQFDLFLDEMVSANGSRPKRGTAAVTMYGEVEFLNNLQMELIHHGCRASLAFRGRSDGTPGYHCLNIAKTSKCSFTTQTIKRVPYDGYVYCLTMPHGNFVTRLRGAVCVTGNSKAAKFFGCHLTERIAAHMRGVGSLVESTPYNSTLVVALTQRTVRRRFVIKLFHGSGGNSPTTGGAGKAIQRAAAYPDADIVCSGHIHSEMTRVMMVERINKACQPDWRRQVHIFVPGYKDDTQKYNGWAAEKEMRPGPTGAYMLRFFATDGENFDFEYTPLT